MKSQYSRPTETGDVCYKDMYGNGDEVVVESRLELDEPF